jgi:type IV secretory pathway TraG/TraD family ATPase VirD4
MQVSELFGATKSRFSRALTWLLRLRHMESFSKHLDARLNLPRPANEQYLTSYKTLLRLLNDGGIGFFFLVATLASCYLFYDAFNSWGPVLPEQAYLVFVGLGLFSLLLLALDVGRLQIPYLRLTARETFGSAHWATRSDLQAAKLLTRNKDSALPEAMPLAPFGHRDYISLPIPQLAEHMVVVGPPGCGKSASFFIHLGRNFASVGGLLALDVKGEIYQHSAFCYKNVYRLDLQKPECSDYFDVFAGCKSNPTRAGQVASYIVGYDANAPSGENPFWPQAAMLMAQAVILHLCEVFENPMPADIFTFLAANPAHVETQDEKGRKVIFNQLSEVMSASPSVEARERWGAAFRQLDNRTMSNVAITFLAKLAPFADSKVKAVTTIPTLGEKAEGRRTIDFRALRRPGTAIYVVVPEGEASRLETVVATFFANALDELRVSGDDPAAAYTMLLLDEAGNVPLRGLSEGVGVGRGRKIIFALGWQNIQQPQRQYGRETAMAILSSIGTKLFLPGCTGDTAEYAVGLLGQTTALQRQSRDAVGNSLDSETLSESGRSLMDASELRQMERYYQAVAVFSNQSPARLRFPPNAKDIDPRKATPHAFAPPDPMPLIPLPFQQLIMPPNETVALPSVASPEASLPAAPTPPALELEDESPQVAEEPDADFPPANIFIS